MSRKALYLSGLYRSRKEREGDGKRARAGCGIASDRNCLGAVGAQENVLTALTVGTSKKAKILQARLIPLFHIGNLYLLGCCRVIRPPLKWHQIDRGLRRSVAYLAGDAIIVTCRRWENWDSREGVVCRSLRQRRGCSQDQCKRENGREQFEQDASSSQLSRLLFNSINLWAATERVVPL